MNKIVLKKTTPKFNSRYYDLKMLLVCFVLCLCHSSLLAAMNSAKVKSPDGQVRMQVSVKNGNLSYCIHRGKTLFISNSGMGLAINGTGVWDNVVIGAVEPYVINQTYATQGVHRMALNHCNGAKVTVHSGLSTYQLDIRVYNDGVAFRYLVPNSGEAIVSNDSTQFNIPEGATVWSQSNIKYYEGRYAKKALADITPGEFAGPPLTIELPNNAGFAVITEGGLIDFAGMSLRANGNGGYNANLTGPTKKIGNIESPWRIIEIGEDLNTLVNCDIVTNVSPACDPSLFPEGVYTDWIRPGKSVWSWLTPKHEITLENMKHFSDMAAELGFDYNLVDEGWGDWKDGTRDKWEMMKELVDYSAKKKVKIWVWKAYPDRNGIDGINTAEKRIAFFKKCANIGIVGLKVDFFDSEAQEIIDFYQSALKDAATYHLMMDFHGANKPTGENRTWPNESTREAIRGLENSPPWAPGNTTLPFTRFLAGPADFTPVHLGDRLGDVTWAQMVATMVVFTSPLMCLGADPQSILSNPCKQMIMDMPTTWDQTIVLPQSKIGELVLFARRKGKTWYMAGMNGMAESKTISVNLSFLKKGDYTISVIKDDPKKQASVLLDDLKRAKGQSIDFVMNAAGGFVAKIDEINKQ